MTNIGIVKNDDERKEESIFVGFVCLNNVFVNFGEIWKCYNRQLRIQDNLGNKIKYFFIFVIKYG